MTYLKKCLSASTAALVSPSLTFNIYLLACTYVFVFLDYTKIPVMSAYSDVAGRPEHHVRTAAASSVLSSVLTDSSLC